MADDIFQSLLTDAQSGAFTPDKPADPDPIFNGMLEEAKRKAQGQNNLLALRGVRANPDQYQVKADIGKSLGVPVDFVGRNLPKLQEFKGVRDLTELMDRNPVLGRFYASGDNADAIKVDELRHLDTLSWLYRAPVEAFESGSRDVDLAGLRFKQLMGVASNDEIARADTMSADREPRTYAADSWFAKGWVGAAQQLPIMWQSMVEGAIGGAAGATAGGAIAAVAGQLGPQVALPEEILSVPAGAAVGFRYGSLAGQWQSSFKLESGLAYDEFRGLRDETGAALDDDVARAAAVISGASSAFLETYSFRKLANVVPGLDRLTGTLGRDAVRAALVRPTVRQALKTFAQNTLKTGATEVTTEVAQEALTVFVGEIAKGYANAEGAQFDMLTAGEAAGRLADTFEQTMQTMTIMGPALSSTRLGHDVYRSRQAARDLAVIEALNAHAQGNELNARLPEKAKEAVRALTENGPVQHVYITPEAFSTYFQTSEEASRFAASAGLTDEYNEAMRLGRDMEVPIDAYYVGIAATEIGEAIKPYVRLSPDNMSMREADEFNAAWDEAQQNLRAEYEAGLAEDRQGMEGEEQIFEDVKNKAMNAGIVPDQASQYAKLYSQFFRVMAQKTGQDAGELYARYGFDVKRALPTDTELKAVDNLELALAVVRAGRIDPLRKRVEKARGPSLVEAIIARGGILDSGGELAGMDVPTRLIRQEPKTVDSAAWTGAAPEALDFNMFTADDVARQMAEEGFFPDVEGRPTPRDLFDAIAEEVSGQARYSTQYDRTSEPLIQQAQGLVSFADMLDQLGLDPATMTDDEIRAALDEAVNRDPDNAALYQPAFHGSQHIFDRFSTDYMGTGEGAQAYGWGLYFSSSREVAEYYRNKLASPRVTINGFDADEVRRTPISGEREGNLLVEFAETLDLKLPEGADNRVQQILDNKVNGYVQQAVRGVLSTLRRDIATGKTAEAALALQRKDYAADMKSAVTSDATAATVRLSVLDAIAGKVETEGTGRLYHVDVPDDHEMMDWDAPLSEQPEHVRKFFAAFGIEPVTPPKIADPEVALILRQAMRQSDGDPLDARDVIDNTASLFNHTRRLMTRSGLDPDSDEAPTPGYWIAEQARDHIQAILDNRKLTGEGAYRRFSAQITSDGAKNDRDASLALAAAGIPGHKFIGHESGQTNYVIYDDSRVQVKEFFQADEQFASLAEQKAIARKLMDELKAVKAATGENAPKAQIEIAFQAMRDTSKARDEVVAALANTPDGIELVDSSGGMHAIITRSQSPEHAWRTTYFNASSGFLGHTEYKTKEAALREALTEGFDKEDAGALARATASRTFFQKAEEREAGKGTKRGSIQIAPGRTIINMFDQADLSTFLHESGHFFLEVFRDLANSDGVPEQLLADWATTQQYLGIGEGGEITTEAHEKFARTFEAYLFEGKAPSAEVAGIMARFRSWLLFVYQSIRKLNAPINDNMRRVMDRMLATDEEIAAARMSADFQPAFASAKDAGMSEAQWKDYVATAQRAVDAAKRDMDARMMQDIARETTAEWRAAKRALRQEVQAQLENAPVYKAMRYLRTGEGLPGERLYLDRDGIVALLGEGALIRLPRSVPPLYRAKGGVHPDTIAELFGFKSGHEMLTLMMSVPSLGRAVNDEVALRMRKQYGDLMGDAVARARVAQAAIATDETGELLAAEIGVLVKKGLATSQVSRADARRLARELVRSKTIREAIRGKLYQNANLKAALEAEKAIRKGDWPAALAAKKRQLLNHYMAMEAREAERDTESAVRYLNKFTGRKRVKGVWPEHLDRIEALLERFDLRKSITLKDEQRRASLSAWLAEQEAQGELVVIPDVVRDDAFRKPYRQMTVDDLLAVRDAVKNIEHLGRRWAKVYGDIEAREFNAKRDEIAASVIASQKRRKAQQERNPTTVQGLLALGRSLEAAMLKLETVFDWMDRGDINGPLRRLIWQPIADAEVRENDLRVKVVGDFQRILGRLDAARLNERITIPGVQNTFLRSDIMAVALNMGNESNLDKMKRGEAWSDTTLDRIVSHLNADEWQAVQGIWDTINSLWPDIAAVQRRLTGVEPPKVEARTVKTPFGELRGGYYPLIYDPSRAADVEDRAAAAADRLFENTYLRPETRHGFTKERAQAYTRPLWFDLNGAARHLTAVIHDVTHREAILGAYKLLTNPKVRGEIEARYSRELYQQMVPWLQSIAHDAYKNEGLQAWEKVFHSIRSRATIMGMGFRIPTMITQLAGYSSSGEMVPAKVLAGAMKDFFSSPRAMWDEVNAKSGEMRYRSANMDRDINEQLKALTGKEGLADRARKFAFYGIGFMDRIVTVPTWVAAYRDHLHREPGDEKGAIAHADKVVRMTAGAGAPKDLAAIARRNELTKLVTMFYSYFSAYYNRQRTWGRDMRRKIETGEGSFASLLARQVFMTVGPAVLANMLVGKGPDEDDEESYAAWMARKIALYPFSALPLVRDAIGTLDSGFGYSFTPSSRVIDEVFIQPFRIIGDVVDGEFEPRKAVKQTIETTGYALALPLGQLASTVDNVWKAIEKDDFQLRDIVLTRPKE